jgi:formylglycine-generating enzyme required for sulfatase activity
MAEHEDLPMTRLHMRMMVLIIALCSAGPAQSKEPAPYLVIDMGGGVQAESFPITELAEVPEGGWALEHKTRKLVLRHIPAGTFVMGSPKGELGRPLGRGNEDQHRVTLTRDFYIGVFEVTQDQWYRVMNNRPSYFKNVNVADSRPVEMVSYEGIRTGPGPRKFRFPQPDWPTTNHVHKSFFMARLRIKTGRLFDLPTSAQWEYACRAGMTNALNSGKDLNSDEGCMNLSELGRFLYNADGEYFGDSGIEAGTAEVGSFAPNTWGLYDMHGNVWEWVLDWCKDDHRSLGNMRNPPKVDPKGEGHSPPGHPGRTGRIARGGSWGTSAAYTRCASTAAHKPYYAGSKIGFRVVVPVGGALEKKHLGVVNGW